MGADNSAARSLAAKILIPAVPPTTLARSVLESRLDEALTRRLTLVIAGPGFGKSTLVASWAAHVHSAWYALSPEDRAPLPLADRLVQALRLRVPSLPHELAPLDAARGPDADADALARVEVAASLLSEAVAERLGRDLALVVEDVHELEGPSPATRLLESLCRQAPPSLHLVLTSRAELPFGVDRLRGRGQVLEIGGAELAFTEEEVAALLPRDSGDLAGELHAVTAGWPAAVRLAIEALRTVPPEERRSALARIRRSGGPLYAYLAAEVLEREPPQTQHLLRMVAALGRFTPELLAALGVQDAPQAVASLARRGLFLELRRAETGWYSPTEPLRTFLLAHRPLDHDARVGLHRRAATWLQENGYLEQALDALRAIDDHTAVARLLADRGRTLLRRGALEAIVEAASAVPSPLRTPALDEVEGAARQIRGDWEGALACFARIAAGEAALHPGLAWRMGIIHHFRGHLDEALALYQRGRCDGTSPRDEALLLAWQASAYWLRGDADSCRSLAGRAFATATAAGDPQALAAAHTVLALLAALDGDRGANDAHYLRALEHAERAGDLLQTIRIHTNRASLHIEEGSYEAALNELESGLALADLVGFASFRALGLTNRGEAQFRLGRLEEAVADLEAAKAIYQRIGSRNVAYPLQKLGDVYVTRGDLELARTAYEEAAALAEEARDQQALVPSLAGLARVLAREEPEQAAELVERALAAPAGIWTVAAHIAGARVALAGRAGKRAGALASEAAAAARARRDRAGLAEALEVQALAATGREETATLLGEARAIWREIRSPIGEATCDLELARLGGPGATALAASAEQRLGALGARGLADIAASVRASLEREPTPPVAVRTLGGFRVLRDGDPVPLSDWQSKKARDLLKILIARRGRPTPRDMLMETLWPEDDPSKLPNRLSVALAVVRSVLDPQKQFAPDHFLSGEKTAVRVNLEHLPVDVELFLTTAAEALVLVARPHGPEAVDRLAAAEAAYTGDFLEEDLYEDWAEPLREEAQTTYIQVARALATAADARQDYDAAGRYLLRVLERDPYDEPAQIALVACLASAGRHGHARRFYRAYCGRMREIGIEPAPYPGAQAA
jgi:ATP/maltotriose-dependent transcriptional regulator MalT/DNA-binding SARP family transcriptional activator